MGKGREKGPHGKAHDFLENKWALWKIYGRYSLRQGQDVVPEVKVRVAQRGDL